MTQISKHFTREEFSCPCDRDCGFDTVDKELLEVLEDLRWYFNSPVIITSGNRCALHNDDIGGAKKSKHQVGIAADIVVRGISPTKIYNYLDNKYPHKYGMGNGKKFTHIDVRAEKARWDY